MGQKALIILTAGFLLCPVPAQPQDQACTPARVAALEQMVSLLQEENQSLRDRLRRLEEAAGSPGYHPLR